MLTAIFYDRKNNREVSNEELVFINAIQELVQYGNQKYPFDLPIGEFGYKSKCCSQSEHWDLHCLYSDLVFLRFE